MKSAIIVKYGYPMEVFENGDIYRVEHEQYYNGKKYFFTRKAIPVSDNGSGYMCIKICKNRKNKTLYVHRLVAEAFIENTENKPEVNHKNGIRNDNRVQNLEWVTRLENIRDYIKKGRAHKKQKKSVMCFNLEGDLVKIYDDILQAAKEYNTTEENIRHVCKGNTNTAMKMFWIYKEDYNENIHTKEFLVKRIGGTTKKTVYKYDYNNNLVGVYKSVTESCISMFGKKIPTSVSKISSCCLGRIKSAYGYYWRYHAEV